LAVWVDASCVVAFGFLGFLRKETTLYEGGEIGMDGNQGMLAKQRRTVKDDEVSSG